MKGKKALNTKEELFCQNFAQTRDARAAAAGAGYLLRPEKAARRLLGREEIRAQIQSLCAQKAPGECGEVAAGLRRLAFGSAADAVRLLYLQEPEVRELEEMELFNIAEIKRAKGGGMEIKFFDRLKALEKLGALTGPGKEDGAADFYAALKQGAACMGAGSTEDTV